MSDRQAKDLRWILPIVEMAKEVEGRRIKIEYVKKNVFSLKFKTSEEIARLLLIRL